MPDFDFDGLRRFLSEEPLQVITVSRESPRADWAANRLEIGDGQLRDALRTIVQRTATRLERRQGREYVDGWVPEPGTYSIAPASDAAGPLIETLLANYSEPEGYDELPATGPTGEPDDEPDDEPETEAAARVMGLVARRNNDRLVLVRAQNPVIQMAPDRLTATLRGRRLSTARSLFTYDGRVDVVVWGEQTLILNANVFESLVRDPDRLDQELTDAIETLSASQLFAGVDLLGSTARKDANFARGLRRIHKAGYLAGLSPDKLREAVGAWGHHSITVVGDRIVFDPESRWDFLHLLDDGYLSSDLTGLRYEVNSKRRWNRVEIRSIERDHAGRLVRVHGPGAWSPRAVGDVLLDIDGARASYYIKHDGGAVPVKAATVNAHRTLWAGPAQGENLIDSLPVLSG